MLEKSFIPYQSVILLSILISPMVYLLPDAFDTMLLPPLAGLVFPFGVLNIYPYPEYFNPLGTRHYSNFTYMVIIWAVIGVLLLLSFPIKYGKKLILLEHLVAITVQVTIPFLLFHRYILVIPYPITPVISILLLWIYNGKRKQSELDQLSSTQTAV